MEKKITSIDEYRRWAKSRIGYLETTQVEIAKELGIPKARVTESFYGRPGGKKYTPMIIKKLGGKEEDFEQLLKAL